MRLVGGTRCISFLRKAAGCNFLVANPTNQLFTAFHRGGCHIVQGARMLRLICCLKRLEQRQVCTRPSCWSSHLIAAPGRMGRTSIDNSETSTSTFGKLLNNFWTTLRLLWDNFWYHLISHQEDGEDGAG